MNPISYLSRYLLAAIFAVELGYKIIDWNGWVAQFGSLLPFSLPSGLVTLGAFTLVILEGLVTISLIVGKEKFTTGLLAALLLLSIMIALQSATIGAGAYTGPLAVIRGFLQDQHLWMMLAAGYVATEGWSDIVKRRQGRV